MMQKSDRSDIADSAACLDASIFPTQQQTKRSIEQLEICVLYTYYNALTH